VTNPVTNEELQALIAGHPGYDVPISDRLLPIDANLREPRISLEYYSTALVKTGLEETALSQLAQLSASEDPVLFARGTLLRLYLGKQPEEVSIGEFGSQAKEIVSALYASSPYYQPDFPSIKSDMRPSRVEVSGPLRIDLGMGGLSDLPPWSNSQFGRAVSLCANIDSRPPIKCFAEVGKRPGIYLESTDRGIKEEVSGWEELKDMRKPTAIMRACLSHLLTPLGKNRDLVDLVGSVLGGGLTIRTFSAAPKGLGASSILISAILQALLSLLGHPVVDWQDVVHRIIAVERLMGIGGGWEDALPAFFGGAVIAESIPSCIPIITAKRLRIPPSTLPEFVDRMIIFDTGYRGNTADVLTEGILRYLSGDPATIEACDTLLSIGEQVATAVEEGNVEGLGRSLTKQWKAWKIVTGGKCTTDYLEGIIVGAEPWADGAKVNGAGSGGAIVFIAKDGVVEQLSAYLGQFGGSIVNWQLEENGYKLREWYSPQKVATFVRRNLPAQITKRSSFKRHGDVVFEVEDFESGLNNKRLVGPFNHAIFDLFSDLPLSVFAVAAAIADQVGTAIEDNLQSAKKLIDSWASAVFTEEIGHWKADALVSISEGKDEYGRPQPSVAVTIPGQVHRSKLGIAVDVVDGTTLAAIGASGAYSICAVGVGLRHLPDMQAYAILAPTSAFSKLDFNASPELALENNLSVIAEALNKRVDELTIVTQGLGKCQHHRTLIDKMGALGVKVIVPESVIVETPYVIAACIDHPHGVDGVIGVFGLPEIVINTVLCGTLDRGKGIVFRLASNTPLHYPEQSTLDSIFDFAGQEANEIQRLNLIADARYTFGDIVSGDGCMVAGAAITPDPVLGLKGIRKNEDDICIDGWLADPCGNLHKLSAHFHQPTRVDYSAHYLMDHVDISLLVEISGTRGGDQALEHIEELVKRIDALLPGASIRPFSQTSRGDLGLHLVIYEFTKDYAPLASSEAKEKAFKEAVMATASICKDLQGPRTVTLGNAVLTSKGVIVRVSLDSELLMVIERIGENISDRGIFNYLASPPQHHIMLASFTQVLPAETRRALGQILGEYNKMIGSSLQVRHLSTRITTRTPFGDTHQNAVVYLPD
jgi:galactokinase/mevalonate kinase-like predicted kinase/fructose-1,6-bisphosphatase/sedoheptulose 1,7-bisphosphatase-like protein